MAQFPVNTHRFDPYKNFKFRIRLPDGRFLAGLSRVSALKRTTEVVTHREGGDPSRVRHSPGLTRYEPITLERGVTHDPEFEEWAGKVMLELYNEAGQLALAYRIFRAWVSEYVVLGDLDAQGHAVAIERIVLQNEGFERDRSISEPVEQSLDRSGREPSD